MADSSEESMALDVSPPVSHENETKIFNDPIHGSIELDPVLVEIIDTPEFQRLRRIKQLGGKSFVYPGAVHTRFEHSIGVCYIAGEMISALKIKHEGDKDPNLKIEDRDILAVKIAALCHDLGHGPFSHVYDSLIKKSDSHEELRKHEYRSAEIFKMISIRLSEPKIDDKFVKLVMKLIVYSEEAKEFRKEENPKEWKEEEMGVPVEKCYLFEIVANGVSGIDVDKMDYFQRDCHGLGLSSTFSWRRYIQTAKIMKVEDDTPLKYHICSRDKTVNNLYELFHIREQLHRTALQHKTAIAAEMMIKHILKEGSNLIKFEGKGITQCWDNMTAFLQLDDSIIDKLWEKSSDTDIAHKLIKRLRERDLYKLIGQFTEEHIKVHVHDFSKEAIDAFKARFLNDTKMDEESVKFETQKIDYGNKENDPLQNHYFFEKNGTLLKWKDIKKPNMIPQKFKEESLLVYYVSDKDDLKSMRKVFDEYLTTLEQAKE